MWVCIKEAADFLQQGVKERVPHDSITIFDIDFDLHIVAVINAPKPAKRAFWFSWITTAN